MEGLVRHGVSCESWAKCDIKIPPLASIRLHIVCKVQVQLADHVSVIVCVHRGYIVISAWSASVRS